jgi:hypoxanthine-DNA glycosylase
MKKIEIKLGLIWSDLLTDDFNGLKVMKLHEAIEKLLQLAGHSMTTQEIADGLNKNKWYRKKDGSAISAYQIYGRIKNYDRILDLDGATVSLARYNIVKPTADTVPMAKIGRQIIGGSSDHAKSSFQPISNSDSTVLILGTMPGDESLKLGEYYSHSRNRFWKIISAITSNDLPLTYDSKKELLLNVKIGIWDVASKASRVGSLDSAIEDEEPNDLNSFIEKHKKLKVVAFNGKKAETLFDKYFARRTELTFISLPSSSPANTGIDFADLCIKWKQILIN